MLPFFVYFYVFIPLSLHLSFIAIFYWSVLGFASRMLGDLSQRPIEFILIWNYRFDLSIFHDGFPATDR